MPRSHPASTEWRALVAATIALLVFTSLIIIKAGAQGRRAPAARRYSAHQQSTTGGTTPQQARRKSIASIRSVETAEGSRVTITSDVPLNDYSAYVNGDRYYVIIPEANLISQNTRALENALRGRGFQDVKIEKRGNDVVISFRLLPGMRARVEQKFNRLDVVFTAPGGAVFNTNRTANTGGPRTPDEIIRGNQQTNTSNQSTTGTGTTYTGTSTTGGAVATNRGGTRGGRSRGGYRTGYGGGGGGGGGGAPLNIPLPSEMALPQASPAASPGASPLASPLASPTTGQQIAQSSPLPSPTLQTSPSPEQIAQAQPQQPVTAPPVTATNPGTTAPAAPASGSSIAAAIKNNWLPLLIVLLVLASVGMLLVSRSRARASGAEPPPAAPLGTARKGTGKASPGSAAVATLAGGAAGAAASTAASKKSAATPAPVKEPAKPAAAKPAEAQTKEIEPVVPAASPQRVGTEVKGLLEGGSYDAGVIGSTNPETRQLVSTELLAALASRNPDRRARAREAYSKHGFFDEATQNLRTAENSAERISAARALGLTQDAAATPHLVAALEDNDPEVRRSAVNALAELRDPSAIGPLNALLEREKNRKVPHSLIRRAIEASATIEVAESPKASAAPTPAAETPAATADKKEKDDDEDREVFEI